MISVPQFNSLLTSLSLSCNVFKSLPSISIDIRDLLYNLNLLGFVIKFLQISSHSSIYGNEIADFLAASTLSLRSPALSLKLWSDFCSFFRTHTNKMWLDQWKNQPLNFSTSFKSISLTIPILLWFHNFKLCKKTIFSFSRLRIGYTLLLFHSYNLFLNNTSLHSHISETICDFPHIQLYWPCLKVQRKILQAFIKS